MNLLFDARPIADPASGGVGRVAMSIACAYAEAFQDDRIYLLTTGLHMPALPDQLTAPPNTVHIHIPIPNKIISAACVFLPSFSLIRLAETYAKRRMDAYFQPNLAFIGNKDRHRPRFLLLHDVSFLIERRWFGSKQQLWHTAINVHAQATTATHLFSVSQSTRRDAIRFLSLSPDSIDVIRICHTLNHATPTLTPILRESKPYALSIGANDRRKNIQTAICAVREWRNRHPAIDLQLTVLGTITPTEPWIHPIPRATDDELATLYANACVFLYPSWYEGYGLPLHEAARYGTPRIASTSGALSETAPPGTLFAHPAKPHHWTEAIDIARKQPRDNAASNEPASWEDTASFIRATIQNHLHKFRIEVHS